MRYAHGYFLTASFFLFVGTAITQHAGNAIRRHDIKRCASDSGAWQTQTTGIPGSTLYALSAVDGDVCWLAGASGTIIRTIDGGNTWSLVNPGIIDTQSIHAFEGVADSIAFAAATSMDTTRIYRTTDGGSSWSKVFSQDSGNIDAIKMFNPSQGIAIGDPVGGLWTILKTTNGGETWFKISVEPPQVRGGSGGMAFGTLDTTSVWFSDNNGRRYSSGDGGETWGYSPDSSTATTEPWFVCWNSRTRGLMVSRDEPVYGYFHGYYVLPTPLPTRFAPTGLVGALGTTEFWLVMNGIWYSPDAGNGWTAEPPYGLSKPATLIDMVTLGSDISAWATGTGDTVYHYHQILTGVGVHSQPIPKKFSLNQNYPNPFNPTTTVSFVISHSSFVTLKVYDVLGEQVTTLVNEVKQPGEYTVSWNAAASPSGVYFCRMLASPNSSGEAGSFTQTRRLVLLK